jgi:hypothetical protein
METKEHLKWYQVLIITTIAILLCMALFKMIPETKAQEFKDIDFRLSKSEKTIITVMGTATTAYGFLKPGYSKEDVYICLSGVIFAAIPYIFDNMPKWIKVNSSGINFKFKYKKYKCKY